jgi:hypothetical protein
MIIGAKIITQRPGEEPEIQRFDTELKAQEAFDVETSVFVSGARRLQPFYTEHKPDMGPYGMISLVVRALEPNGKRYNYTRRELYILK